MIYVFNILLFGSFVIEFGNIGKCSCCPFNHITIWFAVVFNDTMLWSQTKTSSFDYQLKSYIIRCYGSMLCSHWFRWVKCFSFFIAFSSRHFFSHKYTHTLSTRIFSFHNCIENIYCVFRYPSDIRGMENNEKKKLWEHKIIKKELNFVFFWYQKNSLYSFVFLFLSNTNKNVCSSFHS